jgi:hypothetical protein
MRLIPKTVVMTMTVLATLGAIGVLICLVMLLLLGSTEAAPFVGLP